MGNKLQFPTTPFINEDTENMKTFLTTMAFALCCLSVTAKPASKRVAFPGGKYKIYRVALQDKRGNDYSLKHPERFLAERALQRRSKQELAVDSTDLPISRKYLKKLAANGFTVIGGSKWNNTVLVKDTSASASQRLSALPFVTSVTRVFAGADSVKVSAPFAIKADTAEAHYKAKTAYGHGGSQIRFFNGQKLHEAGFRGKGKLVAVVDGGFMNTDKIGYLKNVNIAGTRNCVYPYTSNIYDELDHGTMVLSTMAANSDSLFVGTAPGASYLLVRSEYGPLENLVEEDFWAQAVEYADSMGADIVNSSLSYTQFDDKAASHKYREQDGLTALVSHTASMMAGKGMILVNSAGNEGARSWKRIGFPSDARDILTVGAASRDSVNTTFSSVGPSYDGRVKPDVMAVGARATVVSGEGIITAASGTSFSSPITCGMVACLWQALPDKTASEIMELIRRSADRAQCPDNIYGYGIPDFWKAYQMGLKK